MRDREEWAARMRDLQADVRKDLGGRVVSVEEVVEAQRAVLRRPKITSESAGNHGGPSDVVQE